MGKLGDQKNSKNWLALRNQFQDTRLKVFKFKAF